MTPEMPISFSPFHSIIFLPEYQYTKFKSYRMLILPYPYEELETVS